MLNIILKYLLITLFLFRMFIKDLCLFLFCKIDCKFKTLIQTYFYTLLFFVICKLCIINFTYKVTN